MKKNNQSVAGLIIKQRTPDEVPESEADQDDPSASIHSCAQAIMDAIHSKDIKGLAEALKDAFEILDSEPHVEGEHIEPHSYEAQNIKAGQE